MYWRRIFPLRFVGHRRSAVQDDEAEDRSTAGRRGRTGARVPGGGVSIGTSKESGLSTGQFERPGRRQAAGRRAPDRLLLLVRQGGLASSARGPGIRRRGRRSGGSCPRHGLGPGVVHTGGRQPGRWPVIERQRDPGVACLDVIPAPRLLVKTSGACLDRGAGPFERDRRACVSWHWHPVGGPAAPSVSWSSGGKGRS